MKKRLFLLSFSLLLLLCSCGHRQPTVVEEMAQFRDTLIDRGLYYVCYVPNNPQYNALYAKLDKLDYDSPEYEILRLQIDSILRFYLYYDTTKKEFDVRKDANGNFFTRDLLSNNIQEDENKGYYIDERQWHDDDYEYDYESYEYPFDDLYESIVDINNTPVVNDLVDYFKNIPASVLHPISDEGDLATNIDSIDRPYFESQLRLLQDYIDHKNESFPMEIADYAHYTAWQKSALYNHTSDIIEIYYSYIFQYRLIQQIVYHCPDIELILDPEDMSDDKMLGFAKLGYNDASGYTYVMLKQNSGIYTVDILPCAYHYLEQSIDESGHTIYSLLYGSYNTVNYSFDGNKWHKTEIFNYEPL